MVDQFALNAKWWCYAVESWVPTANSHPMSGITSPLELVTGETVDISATFRFPFGCPVTATNIDGRELHYSTASEFGIAVGSVPGHNKGTLVLFPNRGQTVLPRLDVRPLKLPPTNDITEQQRRTLAPTFHDDNSVTIQSPATADADINISTHPVGTLGVSMFDMPDHTKATPAVAGRRQLPPIEPHITRSAHSKAAPTTTAASPIISFAQVANRLVLESPLPPDTDTHFAGATKRVVRTDANPTLGTARRNESDWPDWLLAIGKE